jgi:hypothetical protein
MDLFTKTCLGGCAATDLDKVLQVFMVELGDDLGTSVGETSGTSER